MRFDNNDFAALTSPEGTYTGLAKVISGGQTGAERAALEWAYRHHIPAGGWCPQGRRAEDGILDPDYPLVETRTRNYAEAIETNARNSDAMLIVTVGKKQSAAIRTAVEAARRAKKPYLHLSRTVPVAQNAETLAAFLQEHEVESLYVTGSRASEEAGIETFVEALLTKLAS